MSDAPSSRISMKIATLIAESINVAPTRLFSSFESMAKRLTGNYSLIAH